MKKLTTCLSLFIITFLNSACSKVNFREEFFKHRPCAEVKYRCLPESQGNQEKPMFAPSKPYVITAQDRANMEQDRTLRMYKEISQMLEIYYPGFWQDFDEKTQLVWLEKVDEITKRYYPNRQDYHLESMASICAIIGLNFETDPNLAFVVQKIKSRNDYGVLVDINDYLRFEVLGKDFDDGGVHYNTWSLRGVQEGMPKITRHIPDFYGESKPQNQQENVYKIYRKTVLKGGR
ncbi:hypothetical protein [Actinobacillus equuli]|uniref:hypothetical protein n=1 Tax=Actinobacillus equuli TaxID=718 RepID=UPI002442BF2D|nr:hypothetical protein [Actinobacillus equuli]WGE42558.1 hypothetical protein NYR64_01560 [Actinobacillus equuli subsp. haemolyticus]